MRNKKRADNEKGFVLITTMLVMLVLTIIGIAANRNTSTELQITGNNKVHKKTFYAAEAGGILGAELIEQNLNCPTGFGPGNVEGTLRVANPIFGQQQPPDLRTPVEDICDIVGNPADNDVSFYVDDITTSVLGAAAGDPETHLFIWGQTEISAGGSLIMAAGYEGKGKSAASGGVSILFDIFSQHLGMNDAETIIQFGWRHLVGTESTCNY